MGIVETGAKSGTTGSGLHISLQVCKLITFSLFYQIYHLQKKHRSAKGAINVPQISVLHVQLGKVFGAQSLSTLLNL